MTDFIFRPYDPVLAVVAEMSAKEHVYGASLDRIYQSFIKISSLALGADQVRASMIGPNTTVEQRLRHAETSAIPVSLHVCIHAY
jgi:hypothetical protein